ncbi:DUF2752 domain-containing protein [Actinotalea sp. Marseille-Q4924]|uniref:DUF2752 domain-containing protein n=1 Tax=Actinotalea sp. Marseille-Q4924 TaxID=2866571 RepID=UPI001CE42D5C|nr:DUF2752 domain-containing protein [Actinotalea sp. Marseille-Q4924]
MHRRTLDAPADRDPGPRGLVVPGSGRPSSGPAARPAWLAPAAVGVLTTAATVALAVRTPYAGGSYGACPFLALTGLWCPACGGLRAVHDLARLDVAGAWGMNPLLVLAVPLLVAAWGLWLARSTGRLRPVGGRAWPDRLARIAGGARSARAAWAVLALATVFTIARNVPALEPWLAPV